MENFNESRRKRQNKARDRHEKRSQRREAMVSLRDESLSRFDTMKPKGVPQGIQTALNFAQDTAWHLVYRTSIPKVIGAVLGVILLLFMANLIFSPNIKPNIWSMDIPLGGKSIEEAEAQLLAKWNSEIQIRVTLAGETLSTIRPSDIGLTLDAYATALNAKDAGLSGIPFGHAVDPIIIGSFSTIQNYMIDLADTVYIPPKEAGYAWQEGTVIGVAGTPSRELDITTSAQAVVQDPLLVLRTGRIELVTQSTPPTVVDPSPFLADATTFLNSQFSLVGYDPFTDSREPWQTSPEEMAQWIRAGTTRLTVNEQGLKPFINNLNARLAAEPEPRYLNENDIFEQVDLALLQEIAQAEVRLRYLQTSYTIASGDTGYGVGRKTGIPFGRIETANPDIDWNSLVVGQVIQLPSRDLVVPIEPIATKRIVVDLDRLYLVAYEGDEVIYHWRISSGMATTPTLPGVFQILEKVSKAYGSSFSMCSGDGGSCSQWEMDYFMSIYEVAPGLMNGFHGAVLLPNGAYMDGGSRQRRSTFGCVMSDNTEALALFDWADVGTMVEIVSLRSQFEPQSERARQALSFMDSILGTQT